MQRCGCKLLSIRCFCIKSWAADSPQGPSRLQLCLTGSNNVGLVQFEEGRVVKVRSVSFEGGEACTLLMAAASQGNAEALAEMLQAGVHWCLEQLVAYIVLAMHSASRLLAESHLVIWSCSWHAIALRSCWHAQECQWTTLLPQITLSAVTPSQPSSTTPGCCTAPCCSSSSYWNPRKQKARPQQHPHLASRQQGATLPLVEARLPCIHR